MHLSRRPGTALVAAFLAAFSAVLAASPASATAAPARPAAVATPAVLACHLNAYEVKDPHTGQYVTSSYSAYSGSTWEGVVHVELWYCGAYQSNFARAWFETDGSGAGSLTVDLSVYGEWGDGPNDARHSLAPGVFKTDGSQDSPTLYAPSEPTEACAFVVGPYTFGTGDECTAFV